MKSSKDFADLLQMIQDKRNNYQRLGTQYDDAEEIIQQAELTPKDDAPEPETNATTEP